RVTGPAMPVLPSPSATCTVRPSAVSRVTSIATVPSSLAGSIGSPSALTRPSCTVAGSPARSRVESTSGQAGNTSPEIAIEVRDLPSGDLPVGSTNTTDQGPAQPWVPAS